MRQVKQKKIKNEKKLTSLKKYLIIFILLIVSCVGIYFSPVGQKTKQAISEIYQIISEKADLKLKQVNVSGHIRTSLNTINEKVGLSIGTPIFNINLEQIQTNLMDLPWIKTVIVERWLPSSLNIRITEKKPIALWQNNKKYFPINTDGKVIQDSHTPLGDMLLVVGSDAPEHTPSLIEVLKLYPEIWEKVRSAVRNGDRRWDLYLNDAQNGLEVKLPAENIKNALDRLQNLNQEEKMLKRQLKMIDLRLEDKFLVR